MKSCSTLVNNIMCLLAAERLLPIYSSFAEAFELSATNYQEIINKAFELTLDFNEEQLNKLISDLNVLIPDSDVYSDVLADQAQCASICLMYCLQYLSSHDFSRIDYVLQKIDEALDIYGYQGGDIKTAKNSEDLWINSLFGVVEPIKEPTQDLLNALRRQNKQHSIPVVN